jgi:hypothetical protein
MSAKGLARDFNSSKKSHNEIGQQKKSILSQWHHGHQQKTRKLSLLLFQMEAISTKLQMLSTIATWSLLFILVQDSMQRFCHHSLRNYYFSQKYLVLTANVF